jgi:hypothetical protein
MVNTRPSLTKRIVYIAASLLMLVTFAAPLVLQLAFPHFNVSLGGVTKKKKLPPLSVESLFEGKFQQRFERWFTRKLGTRAVLIKTDNQLNYDLFSQISSSRRGKAILGLQDHLIEKAYLKRGQGARGRMPKKITAKVQELKRLQKRLSARNIPILILISPNKPSLYPEVIPPTHRVPPELVQEPRPLEIFIEKLETAGIPYINGHELLEKQKENFAYPLFLQTGTHWSELGSCIAARELTARTRELVPHFNSSLTCAVDGPREYPLPMDRDLLSVANLWTPDRFVQPAGKVIREVTHNNEKEFSALFVGTSFLWALFYNLDKANLFEHRDMYYYFKRSFPSPRGHEQQIKQDDPKWLTRALTHDLIIFEVNEAFPQRTGYGFPKKMLRYLQKG